MRIILASSSPRRRDLLEQIRLNFEINPSKDEDILEEEYKLEKQNKIKRNYRNKQNERRFAENRALLKAKDVALKTSGDRIIIGADTIVVSGKKILGKPVDRADAMEMLSSLSGNVHYVITGVALIDGKTEKICLGSEITEVKFRKLTKIEINNYIGSMEPMDKAGAYAIQGLGALLVERISGCYYNVVGLPLTLMQKLMKKMGKSVL